MVSVVIAKRLNEFVAFEFDGHAGYDDIGKDIVCAAVSVLAQTAMVSLKEVAGIDVIYEVDEAYVYCELPGEIDNHQRHDANVIFKSLIVGLNGIIEAYPKHLEYMIEEVESDDD